jgi:hypothetical protein
MEVPLKWVLSPPHKVKGAKKVIQVHRGHEVCKESAVPKVCKVLQVLREQPVQQDLLDSRGQKVTQVIEEHRRGT